jgi:hypothetical protein
MKQIVRRDCIPKGGSTYDGMSGNIPPFPDSEGTCSPYLIANLSAKGAAFYVGIGDGRAFICSLKHHVVSWRSFRRFGSDNLCMWD